MNGRPPAGSRIHLIAICGVGMASLAGLLQSQGYRVSGSDENVYPPMSTYLDGLGIELFHGYSEKHLNAGADLVVVGNAVPKLNPEVQEMLRLSLPYISLPQALGKFLIGSKRAVVVSGTHGKTTTTSLIAWILTKAGWDPSFFIGGIPLNFSSGLRLGKGPWVVMEGDEYDSAFFDKGPKFLHYKPEKVILTSLEFDHADIYRDLPHLKSAFYRLMEIIPTNGSLIVCNEYELGKEVSQAAKCPVTYYGEAAQENWEARNIQIRPRSSVFEPVYRREPEDAVEVALVGRHNINNALAAYALSRELGIDRKIIRGALASFAGVKRRQEFKGEASGITVVDDFAHHPTAIRETIAAIKAAYSGRRLWAIFEPRSHTSRRRIFEQEFAETLRGADQVVVAGLYHPDTIPQEDRLSPAAVVQEINKFRADQAIFIEQPKDIPPYVVRKVRTGDVVLVMSNGGFGGVQEQILEELRQREA